ncbi:YceK/YidQ family lipoprotein [Leptolyngbya ohadii]|uniref:YceK/YidQ family lipoprotein n=1 Tax=Leptolyngbya ohadii TaxID=1962290 RepID=UPI000B59CB79|nr:YceK/YidQ family lipoprotein [Leptolyngbya ohadii]
MKSSDRPASPAKLPLPHRRSIAAGITLALVLTGCSTVTTIQDVQNRPRRWFSTVQLQGTVGDRVPLIGAEVYELKDGTGSIWVLTDDRSLNTGQQVKIRGEIQIEDITIEGQTTQEVYIKQQQVLEKQTEPQNP